MKYGRQYIHCGNCGKRLLMGSHWHATPRRCPRGKALAAAHAPTCGQACNDELSRKYARYVLGMDAEEPPPTATPEK